MQDKIRNFFLTSIFSLSLIQVVAQSSSPYSRYGLGNLRGSAFAQNRSMAGVSAGIANFSDLNYTNPASYSKLILTTFDIGANFNGIFINSPDSTYKTGNGSLTNISMGFPVISGKWGASFGLVPYSHVNYNFSNRVLEPDAGEYEQLFKGSGTLYELYLGNGVQVGDFSLGANLAAMFGSLDYSKVIAIPDSLSGFNSRNRSVLNVRGFNYRLGVQYTKKISGTDDGSKSKTWLTAGAYGRSAIKLNSKVSTFWERFEFAGGNTIVKDTIEQSTNESAKIQLPAEFGVGFSIRSENNWMIASDFTFGNWENFSSPLNNDQLANSWRLAFGGSIVPDTEKKSLRNNIEYRLGFYTGKTNLLLFDEHLSEYGITFGFGIPVKRSLSKVQLAADINVRGKETENLFKETYFKLSAGFTLSDRWFIKRKFD